MKWLIESKIDGIKPYLLPRLVKLKPRNKTNGHSNPKKNKKVLGNSIEKRPEHINFRKKALWNWCSQGEKWERKGDTKDTESIK